MKHNKNSLRLTHKQKQAFNQLKKYYQKCLDEGIYFYNLYGNLYAFDSEKIETIVIEDNTMINLENKKFIHNNYEIDDYEHESPLKNLASQFTDDIHYIILREGKR